MRRLRTLAAVAAIARSLGACASVATPPTAYSSYALREPGPVSGGWPGRNADAATYVQDSKHGEGNGG